MRRNKSKKSNAIFRRIFKIGILTLIAYLSGSLISDESEI